MKRCLPALPLLLLLVLPLLPENFWLGAGVTALMFTFFLFSQGQTLASFGKPGKRKHKVRELDDPFEAEVLLGGRVVARLSDRIVTEMFWRDYRIEAVDEDGQRAIRDDALWEHCLFDFRDPNSGIVCLWAFPGGGWPFVRDSRVSIRGMYFTETQEEQLPKPAPKPDHRPHLTLAEVQKKAAEWIHFLEGTASKHPSLTWVPGMLVLVREFDDLARAQPLDACRIADFVSRYKRHIVENRIKHVASNVWDVDALTRLSNLPAERPA